MAPPEHFDATLSRPVFASRQEYSAVFTAVDYWQPYVAAICERHGLPDSAPLRAGLPGTHPVFIVDERYAVKLYTELFDGGRSFARERDLYALFTHVPQLHAPVCIAHGQLFEAQGGWRWPYIITTVLAGTSYGEALPQIAFEDRLAVAAFLGGVMRTLHAQPIHDLPAFTPTWDEFVELIARRRAACLAGPPPWHGLPSALAERLVRALPEPATLIDQGRAPRLLHSDLNADHLLGVARDGRWQPTGIIDFGDARVGDPLYELVALHLGLFGGDKRLLRAFLASYGHTELLGDRFVERAMGYTLLHEFDVLGPIVQDQPALAAIGDPGQLARRLWAVGE